MITTLYISSLVLLTLGLTSCQIYSNIDKESVVDKILNDTPISFGIKSFTIEITKPTVKPTELNSTEHSVNENKLIENKSNKSSNYANKIYKNALSNSTQSIESINFPNENNQSITKLENTGERPPSANIFEKTLPSTIKYSTESINNLQSTKIMATIPQSTTEYLKSYSNSVQKNENLLYNVKLNEDSNNFIKDNEQLFGTVQQNKTNKMNIIDLYPSEIQDFAQPAIKVEQTLPNDDKNKLTNSLHELFDNDDDNVSTSKIDIELIYEDSKNVVKDFSETDLTGKLQERDGIITDIEKKFRLDDLLQVTQKPIQINQKNLDLIDRRVKKSFIKLPNKNVEKDPERVDIGNTKFNTNVNDQNSDSTHSEGREDLSTTKFYNSKELYNEMLQRKLFSQVNSNLRRDSVAFNQISSLTTTSEITLSTVKTLTDNIISSISSERTATVTPFLKNGLKQNEIFIQNTTPFPPSSSGVQNSNIYRSSTEFSGKTEAINTENAINTESLFSSSSVNHDDTRVTQNMENLISPSVATVIPKVSQQQSGSTLAKPSMPSFRAHILTRLQQKINSLECDIQNVSPDSKIWRGNETHELLLPVTAIENCTESQNCKTKIKTWEGQTEIQSGDVLIVEINDSLLSQDDHANIVHKPTTQVYQVTRPGYEHCDVTEGVLLDITPLVVDEKKLVTLYDKDLTEGVNLLIVVSELWGNQCVRLKVTVKSDNCGENADCSTKGVCFSNDSMEGYECQCCSGFAGSHCEEIDACSPSPCTNNGICVDLSQGHEGNSYQCLCPYGYTGKNCQYESDPCNPAECLNGATCTGNSTHFICHCASGYTGPLCQHNLNECESSPCVHGICVDQESGFRCFCQPGFSGELCNFEYNECESNPCLNDGQCVDQIGGFDCKCTKGYTGSRCQIKVDFCANKPCPEGHTCIDHGNYFSCECPRGRNGPDCNQIPRIQCSVNTCANGGTCWSRSDSFYCACRPGYTGKMCEDEFVVETVVSSSEFMVDDTRNFNEKPFGANPVKSPIELHNAYIAAGTLAAAIFIVAVVVTVCHCKVNQTYRRFSNRQTAFIPIFGFGKRIKSPKSHRHWLSGKRILGNSGGNTQYQNPYSGGNGQLHQQISQPVHERSFQRQLALNLENDMYYTVDFSESQNSPLMQMNNNNREYC